MRPDQTRPDQDKAHCDATRRDMLTKTNIRDEERTMMQDEDTCWHGEV